MAQNLTIDLQVKGRQSAANTLGGSTVDEFIAGFVGDLADGTGNNQASKVWRSTRQLAASANESLDLAGVLTDALGAVITFATIKVILVFAKATNTNDVILGNAASNQFVGPFGAAAHTAAVRPGGAAAFFAPKTGWTVTAGTGDLLKVLNGGGSTVVDYDIVIAGT